MRERLKILGSLILFWLSFMITIRGIFLFDNHDLSAQLTWTEIGLVFLHGLKMDMSMTGYLLMFSGLLLAISCVTNSKSIQVIMHAGNLLFLFLSCAVIIVDIELYRHWGFR